MWKEHQGIPRQIEFLMALSGMTFCLPFMIIAAFLIRITSRGPILFRQKRIGLHGREFIIYKFRTMRTDQAGIRLTGSGDSRVTGIGKWLRITKIDELPQFWNVLRGDMRFVGPRPEVPEYVDLKNPLWQEILEFRPGLTDPVTLRLRNEEHLLAEVENKEEYYIQVLQPFKLRSWAWFTRHKTWKTDIRIICRTVMVICFPHKAPVPSPEELQLAVID
jgi:lipopolysaccharide/colanic/teichoic acid biosynthesis glycosyltransferase